MDIRFLGHAAFALEHGGTTVLIDPFLTGNPKAAATADEVAADAILLTHGHGDHIGDTVAIAKRTGATVVAIVELAGEIGEEGVDGIDPNLGGTVEFDWGTVRLTPAWHTSTTPKGTVSTPAGPGHRVRRQAHLPPRRHRAVQRPRAAQAPRRTSTSRSCASAATTRWTASTPSSPPSWWAPTRSSRATTTRSRRSRPTPRRSSPTSQNAGFAEVVVLEPGETHTP